MTRSSPEPFRIEAGPSGEVVPTPAAQRFIDEVVSRMREKLDLTTAAFWLTPYRVEGVEFLEMEWRDTKANDLGLTFWVGAGPEEAYGEAGDLRATVHDMTDALLLARLVADGAVANAWGRI